MTVIDANLTKQDGVQDETGAESGALAAAGGGEGLSNAEGQERSTQGQEGNGSEGGLLESEGVLPAEVEETRKQLMKDYHAKTQALAEKTRQMEAQMSGFQEKATMLDNLLKQEWFVETLEARRNGKNGQAQGLSAEELEKVGISPEQAATFEKIVQAKVDAQVRQLVPELKKHRSELEEIRLEKAKAEFAKGHPDFDQVTKSEAFKKHSENYDFKAAYALARMESGPQSSTQEAERILAARKAASVLKGGPTKVDGKKVVKSRDFRHTLSLLKDQLESGGSLDTLEIDYSKD